VVTAWWAGALLTAALVGVAAELAARWWIRRHTRYHVWPPGTRLELRSDGSISSHLDTRVRFDVNADGERGRDVPKDEAGLFRVLTAGGSSVEGFALAEHVSWPGALERILNAPENLRTLGARRVHVGNIGRSGVSSRHLDVILERVLPQYRRLSVIVIMVGGSDVFQWFEEGAPQTPSLARLPADEVFAVHPEMSFGWKPRQWAAIELVRRLRHRWLRPLEIREQAGKWLPAACKMRAGARDVRTSLPDPRGLLDSFEFHFRRALQRAQAHTDRVLVMRQPWFEKEYTADDTARFWHGGMGKAWKQTITTYFSLDVVNQVEHLVDARAASVAEELGVEHRNLRSVLAPSLENYYDYVHFTPAGAAVVAREVAAALLRSPRPTAPEVARISSPALAPATLEDEL
jgi:lysophospholipase L1-like esterase